MMKPLVTVKDLAFAYSKTSVFSNLSFSLQPAQSLAIVGASGCGKSTLLRLLHGLLQPGKGSINVDGQSSLVFQDDRLLPWRTCQDNVLLARNHSQRSKQKNIKDVTALFKRLGLTNTLHQFPSTLSGGMQQRVALARALINEPDLLLLDEPFSAVDHLTRQALILELHRIRQTHPAAMVLITHTVDEALFLCDQVLVLGGSPTSIIASFSTHERSESWQTFFQSTSMLKTKLGILDAMETKQQ